MATLGVSASPCYLIRHMRKIGNLNKEDDAIRFGDFLFVKGIGNDVEDGDGGTFEVWVHDDEQLALARRHLDAFLANPRASEFTAATEAGRIRSEQARADAQRKSRVITRERLGYERNFAGFAWLPMVLAVLSLLATLFAGTLGLLPESSSSSSPEHEAEAERHQRRREMLMMTKFRPQIESVEQFTEAMKNPERYLRRSADISLPEVRRGEVWRLISPIFVHFGILHLVFNLMWLRELGGFFQNRFGPGYMALFVFLTGVLSNYGQLLWSGPMFGGMSGVNYALFGFLWMRGKHDRFASWSLNPMTIQTMMVWFVVCFVGLIPNVANFAHGIGLAAGMAWGFISGKLSRGAV